MENRLNVCSVDGVLFSILFTRKTLNKEVATRLTSPFFNGKLDNVAFIEYPKGLPADYLNDIQSALSITTLKLQESVTGLVFVKQTKKVETESVEYWMDKGYEPADADELEELHQMYTEIVEKRQALLEKIGIPSDRNLSHNFVCYIRSATVQKPSRTNLKIA